MSGRPAILLAALLALAPGPAAPYPGPPDAEIGRRIYREGVLPSGRLLLGVGAGDVALGGAAASCARCHRPSGYGGVEGGALVPPVTAPALFGDGATRRSDLFRELFQEELSVPSRARVRAARERPPYTDDALAAALEAGRDPDGRELDALMPRYRLSAEEVGHLAAYLRTLSAAPDPGVNGSQIHFATVIAGQVEAGRRRALLDVLEAYFRAKNAEVGNRLRRPWPRVGEEEALAGGYRSWVLHVWELSGPAEGWPAELARRYRRQPVFALLGGLAEGSWQPIHAFCEQAEVPCLFPETDLPFLPPSAPAHPAPPGHWTVYFSPGLAGEAGALARHLRETGSARSATTLARHLRKLVPGKPRQRILQVYRDEPAGRAPAEALRRALTGAACLEDRVLRPGHEADLAAWVSGLAQDRPAALVLWLPAADLARLPATPGAIHHLYLSATLLGGAPPSLPAAWQKRTLLTWRWSLPGREGPHAHRTRAWLRARGIEPAHDPVQLNAGYALSLVDHALMHMAERSSRELLLEEIEREAEREPNPGVFPHLSLGPGQRIAAKGSHLVRLKPGAPGGIEPAGDLLLP